MLKDNNRLDIRAVGLRLLLPLVVSCSGWVFALAMFHHAAGLEIEGAYYLATFVGALSFVVTGPLAGLMLAALVRDGRLGLRQFAGLCFLVSIPTLGFQIIVFGTSFLPAFSVGQPWTSANLPWFHFWAGVITVALYTAYLLVMYWVARRGVWLAVLGATLLSLGSLAVVVFRVIHS